MEEDIKNSFNRIETIMNNEVCEFNKTIIEGNLNVIKRYIENLIKENKELKEENNKLKTCDGILDVFSLGKESSRQRIEFDYIPKSKIEKVLDKMNERYMTPEAISNSNGATFNYWTGKIDMCIELLEEGE